MDSPNNKNPLMTWNADYHFPKLTCVGIWNPSNSPSLQRDLIARGIKVGDCP